MTFELDTSGDVGPMPAGPMNERFLRWSDLTPFAQGYIEAMPWERLSEDRLTLRPEIRLPLRRAAFRDLAPEAIARIIADCASFENIAAGLGQKTGAAEGRHFWNGQQRGLTGAFGAAFPPLTVTLGDDGKVRLDQA